MKRRTSLLVILACILLNACSSDAERLKAKGFQVFPEMNIALKCPCALKRNPVKENQQKEFSGRLRIYSCKDSVDTEYVLEVLKNSGPVVRSEEQMRDETMKAMNGRFPMEKRSVAGLPSICYTYNASTMGSQIFQAKWNYFLIVHTSLNPKRELHALTSSVRLLED